MILFRQDMSVLVPTEFTIIWMRRVLQLECTVMIETCQSTNIICAGRNWCHQPKWYLALCKISEKCDEKGFIRDFMYSEQDMVISTAWQGRTCFHTCTLGCEKLLWWPGKIKNVFVEYRWALQEYLHSLWSNIKMQERHKLWAFKDCLNWSHSYHTFTGGHSKHLQIPTRLYSW